MSAVDVPAICDNVQPPFSVRTPRREIYLNVASEYRAAVLAVRLVARRCGPFHVETRDATGRVVGIYERAHACG